MHKEREHWMGVWIWLILLLICTPCMLSAQKNFNKNFPKDLQDYTLVVEQITFSFLEAELKARGKEAILSEYEVIAAIQRLYLVQLPQFPVTLIAPDKVDSVVLSKPEQYRYVLKYKVVRKKINKVKEAVISFYFHDTKDGTDYALLTDYNYKTKGTLVLIYGNLKKVYPKYRVNPKHSK